METNGHKRGIIIKQLEEAIVRGGSIKNRVKGRVHTHEPLMTDTVTGCLGHCHIGS